MQGSTFNCTSANLTESFVNPQITCDAARWLIEAFTLVYSRKPVIIDQIYTNVLSEKQLEYNCMSSYWQHYQQSPQTSMKYGINQQINIFRSLNKLFHYWCYVKDVKEENLCMLFFILRYVLSVTVIDTEHSQFLSNIYITPQGSLTTLNSMIAVDGLFMDLGRYILACSLLFVSLDENKSKIPPSGLSRNTYVQLCNQNIKMGGNNVPTAGGNSDAYVDDEDSSREFYRNEMQNVNWEDVKRALAEGKYNNIDPLTGQKFPDSYDLRVAPEKLRILREIMKKL